MLMKISKSNLSYLTKSCRHALLPNEKILRHIYFLSHFATMAIDSANPGLVIKTQEYSQLIMTDL